MNVQRFNPTMWCTYGEHTIWSSTALHRSKIHYRHLIANSHTWLGFDCNCESLSNYYSWSIYHWILRWIMLINRSSLRTNSIVRIFIAKRLVFNWIFPKFQIGESCDPKIRGILGNWICGVQCWEELCTWMFWFYFRFFADNFDECGDFSGVHHR